LSDVLVHNRAWAQRMSTNYPELFPTNAKGQAPKILWIGCGDSRAGEQCLDLLPGEVFVHRNVGGLLHPDDPAAMSVLQFAVEVVGVEHVVICGHSDCGAAKTAMAGGYELDSPLRTWIQPFRDVCQFHNAELSAIDNTFERARRLVELNVADQVRALRKLPLITKAMKARDLEVHGMMYSVENGKLDFLDIP
ncbi:hypothetical protein CANCADRAFT_15810, partial [Tortispora caseinolytica NRRL Y-17796]